MSEYLTFDDVLIKPTYSEITSRENVNIKSYLTKNIQLNGLLDLPKDRKRENG